MSELIKVFAGILLLYPLCYLIGLAQVRVESFSIFFPTVILLVSFYILACSMLAGYSPLLRKQERDYEARK